MIEIFRFDNNPANHATFGKWTFCTSFADRAAAVDYIRRASSPTQQLRIETPLVTLRFDGAAGIRERLALVAAKGPDDCAGWTYNPRRDRWTRFDSAGHAERLEVKQEGSASLAMIEQRWGLDRSAALVFIAYPDR